MSEWNAARRARFKISFDGVDVSDDVLPYFLSGTFTDSDDSECDDFQFTVQDRDGKWINGWLADAINAAAGDNLIIGVKMCIENWNGGGNDQESICGDFELDSISAAGPESVVTIKATSLPYSSKIRQTKVSKAWENYTLSAIGSEIAGENGMKFSFDAVSDPFYERVEQYRQSNIEFLKKLSKDAGLSIKATRASIWVYDESAYESKSPEIIADWNDKSWLKWKLYTQTADTVYASCRVSYVDPKTKACIEGTAYTDDYNEESGTNQQLEVYAKVSSAGEAKELAAKHLRLHNKFSKMIQFTHSGHIQYFAGEVIEVKGYGLFDGKYLCTKAKHTINAAGGYVTDVTGRRILEGY